MVSKMVSVTLCLAALAFATIAMQSLTASAQDSPSGAPGAAGKDDPQTGTGDLSSLELSAEQKKRIEDLMRNHGGRFRSPEFLDDLKSVLSPRQWAASRGDDPVNDEEADEQDGTSGGQPGTPLDVKTWKNVGYAGDASGILNSLDVYAPGKANGAPVMIFVHGGGWRNGDKASAASKGAFFASKGFVLVSVNYRLSPAVVHPSHVEDVAAAVAWVVKNIAGYGGDPKRIFVMGHSAGAHLAALVATDGRRLRDAGLEGVGVFRGVILLDGAGYEIRRQVMELGGAMNAKMYCTAFTDDPETWDDASPLTHAKAGKGFAPFLIFHVASREASRLQSESLAAALRGSGGKAKVFPGRGKTHGTINRDVGKPGDDVTAEMMKFLDAVIAGSEPFADPATQPDEEASRVPASGPVLERARKLISGRDADGDGRLSRQEWPADRAANFDRADTSKDGFVDEMELAVLLK